MALTGDPIESIATTEPKRQSVSIDGLKMAYCEAGDGTQDAPTILFLHGNPTSSYLWRNVWPHVADLGRVIAPDLIGMGESDKIPDAGPDTYRFATHRRFLDAFIETVAPKGEIVLVIHDWGTALGIDWARRHQRRVRAIAYMEGLVMPLSWSDWPESVRAIFEAFRDEAGEHLILENNFFVETVLPNGVLRGLREEEMAVYRRPYVEAGAARWPTLAWPREIPFDGEPADVHATLSANLAFMQETAIPKLFVNARPGVVLTGRVREICRTFPNQQEVEVAGSHFIQEDSPHAIGRHLRDFLSTTLAAAPSS
ncbi:MAG: haloalkane dehalogenase [Alphaproteobacteria bacterium]|nr:MAG: haloalkane dehalogenase [Alphaproteobacteria bacterium]